MPKIILASDHAGYKLKEEIKAYLIENAYQVLDCGCDSEESVDYPIFAHKAAAILAKEQDTCGILLCGTGIGMSIAANRHPGVRAALCHSLEYAQLAKQHNNANAICLGARFADKHVAIDIINAWISSEFLGDRHQRRVLEIENL